GARGAAGLAGAQGCPAPVAPDRLAGRLRSSGVEARRCPREPGDPGSRDRGRSRPRPQVRALLDVDGAGRREPDASRPLRAVSARRDREVMTAVLAVAAVVVALDQIVKVIVLDRLLLGVPAPIIDA